jgi:hypothetical protein
MIAKTKIGALITTLDSRQMAEMRAACIFSLGF